MVVFKEMSGTDRTTFDILEQSASYGFPAFWGRGNRDGILYRGEGGDPS